MRQICFPPVSVNQAGETALDIAKRLKATQCEDLVSTQEVGCVVDISCLTVPSSETTVGDERSRFRLF